MGSKRKYCFTYQERQRGRGPISTVFRFVSTVLNSLLFLIGMTFWASEPGCSPEHPPLPSALGLTPLHSCYLPDPRGHSDFAVLALKHIDFREKWEFIIAMKN